MCCALATRVANESPCHSPLPPSSSLCRADKGGVVHAGLGKASFDPERLHANIATFASAIMAARPKGIKGSSAGGYILSATLSSTMGPGVPIALTSLVAAGQSMGKSK